MKHKFLLACIGLSFSLTAQVPLSLSDAIANGLKHNFNILLARQDSLIEKNDATAGNAGMLPVLTFNANAGKASTNINQKFTTGLEVNKNGVGSGNIGSNVALNWTIFDGFKMFATRSKLNEFAAQGEVKVRQQMENTVAEIIAAYYNVARQQQLFQSISALISFYEERVKIAETRMEIGNGSKYDLLQAKIDLNEQKSALIRQSTLIRNGISVLNTAMGIATEKEYKITDTAYTGEIQNLESWMAKIESGNADLSLAKSAIQVGQFTKTELQSLYYPRLGLNLSYVFSRNTSQAGLTLYNQNLGLNYGLTMGWTIFNAGNTKRQLRDADFALESLRIKYEQAKLLQQEKTRQAWNRMQEAVTLVELEQKTVAMAVENVSIVLERFHLGQSTTLELKDAQNSLLNAKVREANARYDAKIAETELKRLQGTLIQ